jgi:hypothetical protein
LNVFSKSFPGYTNFPSISAFGIALEFESVTVIVVLCVSPLATGFFCDKTDTSIMLLLLFVFTILDVFVVGNSCGGSV